MKWNNYYNEFDKKFPATAKNILEIGVDDGSGLRMLRERYPSAHLYGLDINPLCQHVRLPTGPVTVLIGDVKKMGRCDQLPSSFSLIIDDGSHRAHDMSAAFKLFWWRLEEGGVYVIEDYHLALRSYWRIYSAFFGIHPILMRMIRGMNYWDAGSCWRDPLEISFTPQMVIIRKGSVFMHRSSSAR